MPRKRKTALKNEKMERKTDHDRKQIMAIVYKAQTNEVLHKKYANDLRQIYDKVGVRFAYRSINSVDLIRVLQLQMEHDEFETTFILCLKQLMQGDCNHYTNAGLKFMAEFVTSFQAEDMHPLFDSIFQFIFNVSCGYILIYS